MIYLRLTATLMHDVSNNLVPPTNSLTFLNAQVIFILITPDMRWLINIALNIQD